MANQLRDISVTHVRLTQPLPPLPKRKPQPLAISIPYHDDPAEDEASELEALQTQPSPPAYLPMHDYLRSRQQQPESSASYSDCQPLPQASAPPQEPYRDQPFIITITDHETGETSPPPYIEIYTPNDIEMRNLLLLQDNDIEGTAAEHSEMICKWIVAMLLVALTIAGVGTAFNWGQPSCQWPNRESWRC